MQRTERTMASQQFVAGAGRPILWYSFWLRLPAPPGAAGQQIAEQAHQQPFTRASAFRCGAPCDVVPTLGSRPWKSMSSSPRMYVGPSVASITSVRPAGGAPK